MARSGAGMHVATTSRAHVTKAGEQRLYQSHLLRRTFREDGKVKHQTLANLTPLPAEQIDLLRRSLNGERFAPVDTMAVTVERALPHGAVGLVVAPASAVGVPSLLW